MQYAKYLLEEHLRLLVAKPEEGHKLYAADAVLGFPYAYSIGLPPKIEGTEAIVKHMQRVMSLLRNVTIFNVRITLEGEDSVVGEYELAAEVVSTGKEYRQKYISVLTAKEGKIVLLREYWNPLEATKSFGDSLLVVGQSAGKM